MTNKNPISLLTASFLFALSLSSASALTVPLAWNAPTGVALQGYKVHVGTVSGQYTQTYDVGMSPTFVVPNMTLGNSYYFAVSAIGDTGLESPLSDEINVKVMLPPLPSGGVLAAKSPGQSGLDWTFPKSAVSSYPRFFIEKSTDLVNWTQAAIVTLEQSTGADTQSLKFSWPVTISGPRNFYRLTARNWVGQSTAP